MITVTIGRMQHMQTQTRIAVILAVIPQHTAPFLSLSFERDTPMMQPTIYTPSITSRHNRRIQASLHVTIDAFFSLFCIIPQPLFDTSTKLLLLKNMVTFSQFESMLVDQWKNHDDGILILKGLGYLDVVSLNQKKTVCKEWQRLCTQTIDEKYHMKKKFQSNDELIMAVKKYCGSGSNPCTPKDAESIASTYGYPIDKWDVSNIQDFSRVFYYRFNFNEGLGSWDVSNARTTHLMFCNAHNFNQDILSWDVSNVTNMKGMFWGAESFDQDISSWDVSSVKDMDSIFNQASSFNQDISSWNVSNATGMTTMFYKAIAFNHDISSWDVSNVKVMKFMFEGATSFDQDLSSWDTSKVVNFRGMFYGCKPSFDAKKLPWFNEGMLGLFSW